MRFSWLFEFGDLNLPAGLNAAYAWFLDTALKDRYDDAVEPLARVLAMSGSETLIDLGAGKAGYWATLNQRLHARGLTPNIIATDQFPSKLPSGSINTYPAPVNFRDPPEDLKGVWTMFSALHHLSPGDLDRLLHHCARTGRPFCAVEITERSIWPILTMPLSALLTMLRCLFERDIPARALLWTIILPVLPLFYCWDGIVSHLKAFGPDELKQAVDQIDTQSYHFEIGSAGPSARHKTVRYLIGYQAALPDFGGN